VLGACGESLRSEQREEQRSNVRTSGAERGLSGLGRVLLGRQSQRLREYFVGCCKLGWTVDLLIACDSFLNKKIKRKKEIFLVFFLFFPSLIKSISIPSIPLVFLYKKNTLNVIIFMFQEVLYCEN
jgi:hypothetical protein